MANRKVIVAAHLFSLIHVQVPSNYVYYMFNIEFSVITTFVSKTHSYN